MSHCPVIYFKKKCFVVAYAVLVLGPGQYKQKIQSVFQKLSHKKVFQKLSHKKNCVKISKKT